MKKTLLTFVMLLASVITFAQNKCVPEGYVFSDPEAAVVKLATCPDFTITTTDGVTRNLYTTLGAGNSVLLDQFYTTCYYCQTYAPIIDQSYVAHGSGTGNIQFWGIDQGNNNAQVIAYMSTYDVTNPCASGTEGGGNAADAALVSAYGNFTGYPTYSVVCPNHTVSWDVNYPPTATGFNSYFSACGTSGVSDIPSGLKLDRVYPVPASTEVNFDFTLSEKSDVSFEIYNRHYIC